MSFQRRVAHSATVWLDQEEKEPRRRFKLFRSHNLGDHFGLSVYFSPDGIHWGEPAFNTGSCGDRSTAFWNPFRQVWVYSLRHGWGEPRRRRYWETRLGEVHRERETEPERIRALYEVKARRVEPIGLVYLWPVTN